MNKTVDARGLACPQPVILTRRAMAEASEVTTLVSGTVSRDNVRRMAEKAGRTVTVEQQEDEFVLHIVGEKVESKVGTEVSVVAPIAGSLVLAVSDKKMGRGDEELGGVLVRGFFHTLGEINPSPDTILFYNAGVWLTLDDSPVLEDLEALEAAGTTMLVCGTCLNHYGVVDRLAVGTISNMYDIAETMLSAGKIVTL